MTPCMRPAEGILFHVFPPIVILLETQYLADLPIAQWSLLISHLPRNLHIGALLLQEVLRLFVQSDSIVRSVEHLEPEAVFLAAQIADSAGQLPPTEMKW